MSPAATKTDFAELEAHVLKLGIGIVVANAALTFAIVRLVVGDWAA